MPIEHTAKSGFDIAGERKQVAGIHLGEVALHCGEHLVAIPLGGTVSGEMLRYREHQAILHSARESDTLASHILRKRAVGAVAEHTTFGGEHIEHRGEIDIDAEGATFTSHTRTIFI